MLSMLNFLSEKYLFGTSETIPVYVLKCYIDVSKCNFYKAEIISCSFPHLFLDLEI